MARPKSRTRRGVLTTVGTLLVPGVCSSVAAGGRDEGPPAAVAIDRKDGESSVPERGGKGETDDLTGMFEGTVDRIVDDEQVVILVEEGDEVVDQVVEPRDELPDVREGDAVRVWLFRGEPIVVLPS